LDDNPSRAPSFNLAYKAVCHGERYAVSNTQSFYVAVSAHALEAFSRRRRSPPWFIPPAL